MNKNDFALYEKKGKIYSMGFEFNNLLTKNGLPAMVGGGHKSNSLNSIGLPIGLLLFNSEGNVSQIKQQSGGVIDNNLYNKLLHLAEQRSSTKSKTKKHIKKRRNKTRKLK